MAAPAFFPVNVVAEKVEKAADESGGAEDEADAAVADEAVLGDVYWID